MYVDSTGHSPEWWQWLISGLEVAAGIALCFVPGMQGFGVTLIGTGAGYQKVLNLWGGRVANSLAKSISQNFTKSALIIWGTTAASYKASYWLKNQLGILGGKIWNCYI